MISLRNCSKLLVNVTKLSLINTTAQRNISRRVAPILTELTRRKRQAKNRKPVIRSEFLEWNRDAELFAFNERLSEKFDKDLLEQALTHRSYVIKQEENQKKLGIENPEIDLIDNRELIAEGEQILPQLVESYLSATLPYAPQECIFDLSNYLLSNEMLSNITKGIGLKELVLSSEYPIEEITLANTFYALISSLNRSVDLNHTGIFVRDFVIVNLAEKDLMEIYCPDNPIEILNDILMRENKAPVELRIIGSSGITTIQAVYHIALYSDKNFISSGFGDTIEEASKAAGLKALSEMFGLSDSSQPIKFNLQVSEPVENLPLKAWRRSNS